MENQNEEPKKHEKTEKNPKGGGRPNRRHSYSTIALRIPKDVYLILAEQENRSQYIIEAIRAYHKEQNKHTIFGIELSYTRNRK